MTPEGRNGVDRRNESSESRSFLEGGFSGKELKQHHQQPLSGEDVWLGLGEWIKAEAASMVEKEGESNGHTEVFLADGAVLLLPMGPNKIKVRRGTMCVTSLAAPMAITTPSRACPFQPFITKHTESLYSFHSICLSSLAFPFLCRSQCPTRIFANW